MDLSAMKDLYIGSIPVQSAWLGGTKVWERTPAVDIQAIKDAMLLWYDLKRQGATNETMKANPILKDLSGNGHDATCYNFAWSGMSGIDGYPANSSNVDIQANRAEWINSYTAKVTNAANGNLVLQGKPITGEQGQPLLFSTKEVHFRISGLTEGQAVAINYGLDNGNSITWISNFEVRTNGEYTIPSLNEVIEPYDATSTPRCMNNRFTVYGTDVINNIIIEFLPEYPNALVADGVDDYAKVEDLPLLDDYTVIVKRDFINIDANGVTAVKGESVTGGKNQAFSIDILNYNSETYYGFFGNTAVVLPNIINAEIVEATPRRINDKTVQIAQPNDIWPYLHLCGYPDNNRYNNIALYSFILFNRTLTEEEINWVKTNLIEGDTEL